MKSHPDKVPSRSNIFSGFTSDRDEFPGSYEFLLYCLGLSSLWPPSLSKRRLPLDYLSIRVIFLPVYINRLRLPPAATVFPPARVRAPTVRLHLPCLQTGKSNSQSFTVGFPLLPYTFSRPYNAKRDAFESCIGVCKRLVWCVGEEIIKKYQKYKKIEKLRASSSILYA